MENIDKIKSRLANLTIFEPNTGCWLWTGKLNKYGYGQITMRENNAQRSRATHRVSYQFYKGEIPTGMQVCHSCDVRSCYNPDHLFLGTAKENSQDKVKKNRQSRGESSNRSKLSVMDIVNIRSMKDQGMNNCHISKLFGVHHTTIRGICNGEIWRHVPKNSTERKKLIVPISGYQDHTNNRDLHPDYHKGFTLIQPNGKEGRTMYWYMIWHSSGHCTISNDQGHKRWIDGGSVICIHFQDDFKGYKN